jgi:hypothetical protein
MEEFALIPTKHEHLAPKVISAQNSYREYSSSSSSASNAAPVSNSKLASKAKASFPPPLIVKPWRDSDANSNSL